nr:hypothetical protein SYMBAF_90188 [Serratia symbiotica]
MILILSIRYFVNRIYVDSIVGFINFNSAENGKRTDIKEKSKQTLVFFTR